MNDESSPEVPTAVLAVRVTLVAALAGWAGAMFFPVFGWQELARPVIGAMVVPAAITWVARKRPVAVALAAALVGFLAGAAVLVFQGVGGLGHEIVDSTVNGWARILTTTIPADPDADLLFVPFALTFVAAALGAELVVRRGLRVAAALPAVLVVVVAEMFSAGLNGDRMVSALVVLAVLGSLALTDHGASAESDDAGTSPWSLTSSPFVRGIGALVVVAAVAGIVGPHLPGHDREPFDPRRYQDPPNDPRQSVNPLAELGGWRSKAQADSVLFRATVDRDGPLVLRFRLVALDHFDGRTWSEGEGYRTVGVVLPSATGLASAPTVRVDQQITVEGLSGIWLPAADRPDRLTGATVLQNRATGTLVRRAGDVTDLTYRVRSEVRDPAVDALRGAAAPLDDPALGQPKIPAEVTKLAVAWTQAGVSPYEKALLIKEHLGNGDFKVAKDALPGHDTSRLLDFLGLSKHPAAAGDKRGDAEQFATAFGLVARAAGLPSRVVVGFNAGRPEGDDYVVRGAQATAWAEVYFDGLGWYPFDTLPGDAAKQLTPEEQKLEDQKLKEEKALSGAIHDPKRVVPPPQPPPPRPVEPPSLVSQVLRWTVGVVGFAVLAFALFAGSVIALRAFRRRRRRNASAAGDRVIGAWRDVIDELAVRGVRMRRHMTVHDLLDEAGDVTPAVEPLVGLGSEVNRLRFGDPVCSDGDAERAWRAADAFRSAAAQAQPRLRRLRWRLDPRALVARY